MFPGDHFVQLVALSACRTAWYSTARGSPLLVGARDPSSYDYVTLRIADARFSPYPEVEPQRGYRPRDALDQELRGTSSMHARPFEHHLREAIALNRGRAPRYAALSHGASRPISYGLIAAEYLLLPVARWFDRRAAPYHRAGIPLLDAVFVSMAETPEFGSIQLAGEQIPSAPASLPAATRRRVGRAYRDGSFAGAATALAHELEALAASPHTDAMVRHLLESAHRLATLAPDHLARSEASGLPSPEPLLARLLRMHLWGLTAAAALDRRALPLQARGIPILVQDVPPIPALPSRLPVPMHQP